jgi:hypothetical protein
MVLVIVPAKHEVAYQTLRVAQFDRHEQKIVNLRGVVCVNAFFQCLESLFAGAWGAVEITIDRLILEDHGEIVKVPQLKGPQYESLSENGLKELNHFTVLMVLS